MITVSVTGVEGVQQTLAKIVPQSTKAVRELAQKIYELADQGADKHTKTGALRRSLYLRSLPNRSGWEIGHDRQMAPHAVFVHWGTRPHVIRPKTKKLLRWATPFGKWVSNKAVNHPGYKGDPWLIRAADQAVRSFDQIVAKHLKG